MQVFDHVLSGATGADSLTLSVDRRLRLDSGRPAYFRKAGVEAF